MKNYVNIFAATFIMVHASDSSEDANSISPHVNFHEIFSGSLAMLSDDVLTTRDEHLHHDDQLSHSLDIQNNFVNTTSSTKLKQKNLIKTLNINATTTTYGPITRKSKNLANTTVRAAFRTPLPTAATSSTTKKSTSKSRSVQKGILDILFPPSRVESFKNSFDSVRQLLSFTF